MLAEVEPGLAVGRDAVVRGFAALPLAGPGRDPGRAALAGHRRRAQRRLGRGAGRDPPHLLPADAAGPSSSARPATRTSAASSGPCLPLFDAVIATRYVENPRSVLARDDRRGRPDAGRPSRSAIAADPAEALDLARRLTAPDGLICVTGSLFLAAEARAIVLQPDPADARRGRT